MGLIGSIIGGVTSAVGGIAAGNALSKGYKEQQEMYDQRLKDIKAHRDKVYYQDPTQTTESQAAVTQAQDLLNRQSEAAHNRSIVTGGTEEGEALQKQAAAATVGNMLQQQAVEGAAKKEQAYQNAEDQVDAFTKYLADSKLAQAQRKAQAITQAAGGLAGAASGLDLGGKIGKTGMSW